MVSQITKLLQSMALAEPLYTSGSSACWKGVVACLCLRQRIQLNNAQQKKRWKLKFPNCKKKSSSSDGNRCAGKSDRNPKKVGGINLTTLPNVEKAEVIDALRPIYRLKELLELFQISKSSYFYSERAKERDKYSIIRTEIKTIFQENGKCYGYPWL